MKSDHFFRVNGIRMLWRYVALTGNAEGWAYIGKKILIDSRLKNRRRLECEVHEFLHQANPTIGEEHIESQSAELARILWALGYRRIDEV